MLPVDPAPEPDWFNLTIRQPGKAWLETLPELPPTKKQWATQSLWNSDPRVSQELFAAYGDLCVYGALRCLSDEGRSVDHVRPKSAHPNEAYDWDNYLPARHRLNALKNDYADVLDPRQIGLGWFQLSIPE